MLPTDKEGRDSRARDPWRDDIEMSCSLPPDPDRVIVPCHCQRPGGKQCNQGRTCPQRFADGEVNDRRYLMVFAVWVAIGTFSLWVILDPLGVLAFVERLMP